MILLKIVNEWKEFQLYRKSLTCQTIDITPAMKNKLVAFDYDVAQALYNITLDRLSKEMIAENLSVDFVRGAKFALSHFKKHFK